MLTGVLALLLAIGAGIAARAALPAMQVFVVTFAILVGGYATVLVAGGRVPRPAVVTVLMLAGVAGCVATSVHVALAYPAAAGDPSHLYSLGSPRSSPGTSRWR